MANNYGSKSNDELILAYGFAIPDNPEDHCLITLSRGGGPVGSPAGGGHFLPGDDLLKPAPHHPHTSLTLDPQIAGHHQAARISQRAQSSAGNGVPSSAAPSVSGGTMERGLISNVILHMTSEGPTMSGGDDHDDDDDEGMVRQRRTEELQRDVAMSALGLPRDHHLTVEDPLPESLVHSARICLMDAAEVYVLGACTMQDQGDIHGVLPANTGRTGGRAGGPAAAEGTMILSVGSATGLGQDLGQGNKLRGKRPRGLEDDESGAALPMLPDSAMHILPQKKKMRVGPSEGKDVGVNRPDTESLSLTSTRPLVKEMLLGGNSDVHQLSALVLLRHQLESRLKNLLSDPMARDLLGLPPRLAALGEAPLLPEDDGGSSGGIGASAAVGSLSRHAVLALGYVGTQRQILIAGLEGLRARVTDIITDMHQRVLSPAPLSPVPTDFPGSVFDLVTPHPAADKDHNRHQLPAVMSGAQSSPASAWSPEFGISAELHVANYAEWLAHGMGVKRGDTLAHGSPSRFSRGPTIGLQEVICRPRGEALIATSKEPDQAAKKSMSGSGKRRPLASVTLRSLRNHTSGTAEAAVASRSAAATAEAVPRALSPAPAPPTKTPTLPSGISAALGLDLTFTYDPMAWGALTTIDLKRGDLIAEVCNA